MSTFKNKNTINCNLQQSCCVLLTDRGSVLVYLVVVILIFGVLGVTMVSLFTTATTSSATPNDARRACSSAESGVRYAFSQLRDNDFFEGTIDDLNATTYNVTDAGSFSIRAFSLWFESPLVQNGSLYTLYIPAGVLPMESFVPANQVDPKVWAINFEYTEIPPVSSTVKSPVTAYARVNDSTLTISTLNNIQIAARERMCLAVEPSHDHIVSEAGDLYIESVAKEFFPRYNGAININRFDYSYDRLVDEPENNRVRLTNLTAFRFRDPPYEFPLTITKAESLIVLSPRNYMVIPTGISGPASCGGDYKSGIGIYDTDREIPAPPDINADEFTSNLTENETSHSFIGVDTAADTLNIGGGVSPADQAEFGTSWYDATKSIGGRNNFCQSGSCLFGLGIRVFFILNFVNGLQGDGLTFTLMNSEGREEVPPNNLLNDINSVGGDFQLSELMGYAGDSRTIDGGFLDPSDPRGILPPKLAIEFDTRANFDAAFEGEPEPKDFCVDLLNLKSNTRNDPLSGNMDAVQYIFWGGNSLNVPCRSSNPSASVDTYDDNRHGTTDPPINNKTIAITSKDELDSSVVVDNDDDWLNGSTLRGPWAVRIEIEREEFLDGDGNFDGSRYTIQTWIRQCATEPGSNNCTDASIIGIRNPFQNTRLKYNFSPSGVTRLQQQIELAEDDHNDFERFFFGFTGAAGSESLDAEISQFQLSFIRPGDPEVTSDPNWSP